MNDNDVWMLGHMSETHQRDFTNMKEETEHLIASLHKIALSELLSRSIISVWDWELRTAHMFQHNALTSIHDVTSLSVGRVNRLIGCGYTTKKEVYEVFRMYHIELVHWRAREMNYQF